MRKFLALGPLSVVALALSLSGCVPSVFPLYTDKDARFDPALVGEWAEAGSNDESWTFTKSGDNAYDLVIREKEKSGPFDAHLLRLGARQFIDITPDPSGLNDANLIDAYKAALIPGHMFAKVVQLSPALKIAFLDPKWIKDYLHDHPAEVAHYLDRHGEVMLTAPTRELQAFVTKHADDKNAFGGESDMRKKK